MEKDEGVGPFFRKITQVRDQLSAIGVPIDDDDILQIVFYGIPSSWETFLDVVSGRKTQTNLHRLWHDCLEEEGRIQSISNENKEGNLSLTSKAKKFNKSFPPKKK